MLDKILSFVATWMPIFTVKTASKTQSVGANANARFTFSVPTVSGFTAIGIIHFSNSHGASVAITEIADSSIVVKNLASSAQNITLTAHFLYCKNIAWRA